MQLEPHAQAQIYAASNATHLILDWAGTSYLALCLALKNAVDQPIGSFCVGFPETQVTDVQLAISGSSNETRRIIERWIIGISVIVLAFFALASFIAVTCIVRPLVHLSEAAKQLSTGNVQLEVQSHHGMGILAESLRESTQTKELQNQQEELRVTNEELEAQGDVLRQSELKLQRQQENLRQTNEELVAQTRILEQQRQDLQEKNLALEKARNLLEEKARELELSSNYKSEFLANMSHELRTPLNSLLILSKLLCENKHANLNDTQIEYARTIYASGTELLGLINEVLDLAKVEAGKMVLTLEDMSLKNLGQYVEQNFRHMTDAKGLTLCVELEAGLPPYPSIRSKPICPKPSKKSCTAGTIRDLC